MAVAENAGAKIGSPSGQNLENTVVSSDSSNVPNDLDESKPESDSSVNDKDNSDQQNRGNGGDKCEQPAAVAPRNGKMQTGGVKNQSNRVKGIEEDENGEHDNFKKDMKDLVDILSKLNPMAQEFVPPSLAAANYHYLNQNHHQGFLGNGFGFANNVVMQTGNANVSGHTPRRRRNGYNQGKRRMNSRTSAAQRDEVIRRTVYVSDLDQLVTEEQLADLFHACGQVVDCRICGDPNSCLRFAFVEFTDEEGARAALSLGGTMLGYYPVRVLPSKTAIAPVNPTFLPRSEDEREMCSRTIYVTNIDKKVTQADVKQFFESICGEVQRLRLLGDYQHSTRIAFVEFSMAASAIAALNCSGAVMGSLPIRVSPSKTPVRPRAPRSPMI
ncbi:RRM_1 domain-containing protein/PAM2 domain-containing protein/RRM_6 domain-containing protein [Cephalotus follicularis]|uniref:RRM_1 domain-containing protein/PAM2 domain-containing protein/RRM_6 domain-containing protein n=1 Tax=Cephalotus follicularis TaxID=3775 RepID=A0A1Q3BZD4_CEPFO|nr:RRM_1 domain-containing protein/PAM2 domain-containing protein/RRM_6 domain-containing protein [Cephalotus follicularis]